MGQMDDARVVVAIAQAGGLAAAEVATGLSRAALSRTLSRVEARLGARLARRSSRGFALTEVGRFFVTECAGAVERIEMAEARFRDGLDWAGPLRVTAPPLFANTAVVRAISRVLDRRPGLRVELRPTGERLDLLTGDLDLAFRAGDPGDADVVAVTVAEVRLGLYAPRAWAERLSGVTGPADVSAEPFILCNSGSRRPDTEISLEGPDGTRAELEIVPRVIVSDYQSVGPLIATGAGLALLPQFHGRSLCADGLAVALLPDWTTPPVTIRALMADGRRPRDGVRDLIAATSAALGGLMRIP